MPNKSKVTIEDIAKAKQMRADGKTWVEIAKTIGLTPTGLKWHMDATFRAKTMASRKKYYEGNKMRVKKSILLAGVKHGIKTGLFTKQEAIDFINGLTFPEVTK